MTKEEKVAYYLDQASMPENLCYDTSDLMEELGITEDDIADYRQKLTDAMSMKSVEKRNLVVKQVIKPLLKKFGFSSAGQKWHRETDDVRLTIEMQNSQFNGVPTGVSFRFFIRAVRKDGSAGQPADRKKPESCELKQFDFLPYCGMLSPLCQADWYNFDGYKDYLPSDMPVEDICRQIEEDFGSYVLPELSAVKTYEDFLELQDRAQGRRKEKEVRLLQFYEAAQSMASVVSINPIQYTLLVNLRKNLGLSAEDVASHLEWLDVCRERSAFTKIDARELAVRASKED